MARIEKSIEVDVPLRMAYNQWTQFETFPEFMPEVREVRQLDDTHLHWRSSISGLSQEWDAVIVEQIPDERIAWRSTSGAGNNGSVSFRPVSAERTHITLVMEYNPEGLIENLGTALGVPSSNVEDALWRFKEFIEERAQATGAWRGEVHNEEVGQAREVAADTTSDPGSSDELSDELAPGFAKEHSPDQFPVGNYADPRDYGLEDDRHQEQPARKPS